MQIFIAYSMLGLLILWGIWLVLNSQKRTAFDVFADLAGDNIETGLLKSSTEDLSDTKEKNLISDELGQLGLFDRKERLTFKNKIKLLPVLCAFVFVSIALLSGNIEPGRLLPALIGGLALGYLAGSRITRVKKEQFINKIEFSLPIVMERLVMAIEAGLDIIAALNTITDKDYLNTEEAAGQEVDPVTRLLKIALRLTEAGLNFDQALKEVAMLIECSALRHAFIHLALAHREGGELILPLRELSDSTQLYYQESVEEEIAKLPVKATMPLLCTFAGLIVCFITTPLIQIITMMESAIPK